MDIALLGGGKRGLEGGRGRSLIKPGWGRLVIWT